jgi:hypothetical protein
MVGARDGLMSRPHFEAPELPLDQTMIDRFNHA